MKAARARRRSRLPRARRARHAGSPRTPPASSSAAAATKGSRSIRYSRVKSTAPFSSSTVWPPAPSGSRSTPTRSAPAAAAARTASSSASAEGSTATRVPPRAMFVRHSPGAATREIAPTAAPPATTTRRSDPAGGTSSCSTAPCRWNQSRCSSERRWRRNAISSSQSSTSRPQLPKRGLTTSGPSQSGTWPPGWRMRVRGWGRPARWSTLAVRSLSCAASSAPARLRTLTPRAASEPSAQSPSSTPSSPSATSSRPSATAPGCSSDAACWGARIRASTPRGAAAARATFVAVRRWATIASSTTFVSQRIPPSWATGR